MDLRKGKNPKLIPIVSKGFAVVFNFPCTENLKFETVFRKFANFQKEIGTFDTMESKTGLYNLTDPKFQVRL